MLRLPHQTLTDRTNVQVNDLMVKFMRICGQLIGLDVYLPNLKVNIKFILTVMVTHIVIISFCFLMLSDETINTKLEAISVCSLMMQGIYKLWTIFINSHYYCDMSRQLRNLHTEHAANQTLALEIKTVCFYWFVIAEIFTVCYFALAAAFLVFPVFMWLVYHVQVTIIPIPLPLIDWHTSIGYAINIVHQVAFIMYGAFGILGTDILFLYQILHAIVYLKIFNYRVKQLNETIESEPQNIRQIQAHLLESIKAHQDYISFIEMVDEKYALYCFGQLGTSQLILTLSIFMTLWNKWIIGPFLCVAGLFQMLEYCILGTVVTIQNEKASEIIYNISWYLLPVRYQRFVILMIQRGQNPAELNVGKFAKLNVETAMQILKATYTYLMYMVELINQTN